MEFTFTDCQNDKRIKQYQWREPKICSEDVGGGARLLADETVNCVGCGKGTAFNKGSTKADKCEPCQDGHYQDVDNKNMQLGNRIESCHACGAGHYAPKILELSHFEDFPQKFRRSCQIASPIGNPSDCDVMTGWHVNKDQMLDSSGQRGIPPGLKYSFKSIIKYENILGGRMQLTFKMTGFTEHEYFRIMINGVVQYSAHTDTVAHPDSKYEDERDGFMTIRSSLIQYGNNSFEISAISNHESQQRQSKARVQIKKIQFLGSNRGGAQECLPVTTGFYAPALSRAPLKCQAGHQPDLRREKCERCPDDQYNPVIGGHCKSCPSFTHPNRDRTACLLYDQVIDKAGTLWQPYNLSPDQFCKDANNQHVCNKQQSLVGPMRHRFAATEDKDGKKS